MPFVSARFITLFLIYYVSPVPVPTSYCIIEIQTAQLRQGWDQQWFQCAQAINQVALSENELTIMNTVDLWKSTEGFLMSISKDITTIYPSKQCRHRHTKSIIFRFASRCPSKYCQMPAWYLIDAGKILFRIFCKNCNRLLFYKYFINHSYYGKILSMRL